MKGSEANLLELMEGGKNHFVIPVYQRRYDWKTENCRQLYEDLKKVIRSHRSSHFFGSIVCSVQGNGSQVEYYVIDGQQRLTTVSLLLLALHNLLAQHKISSDSADLCEEIRDCYLISKYSHDSDKFKMRLLKGDRDAFRLLFGDEQDFDLTSNLTHNYQFFCDVLRKQEVSVDELYNAIGKLSVISITLDADDNAQLIFESLNSTGLALEEGDKIRNYILMNQPPQVQNQFYEEYWLKIERCTRNDVSPFVRDYLSIKRQSTPSVNKVYQEFKSYAESTGHQIELLLQDMLHYARLYEKLLTGSSGLQEPALDGCMKRMNWLEISVTRPFLMEVLSLNQGGKLTTGEVSQVFSIVENYLFRRNICEVPTNALNKIFLNLNREVLRYDGTADCYVDKLIYALLAKRDSGRFPDDIEFSAALEAKQVYLMRGKYKAYLFERFENFGTVETKDVFQHLENGTYTIEHIMPQHLTPAWTESLGPDYAKIHADWLHRLANLTLTGYNPTLSNKTFLEKRDAEDGGYKASGLRMNQKIARKDRWGLAELQERSQEMVERAKQIWGYPSTAFQPMQQELESCTLDDDELALTGRTLQRYSYQNVEQPAASWADMFESMVKYLHQKDRSVLYDLSRDSTSDLSSYIKPAADGLRMPLQIDDRLYMEKNTSTAAKLHLLRKLFALYQADLDDLVFYLRDSGSSQNAENTRSDLRLQYWTYALPIIQKQNLHRGTFGGVKPSTSNTVSGFFGISGNFVSCIANYDGARVDFFLGTSDAAKNKADFDKLFAHKSEVESAVGASLQWNRADQYKMSWISYSLSHVSIAQPEDWPRMAAFHAEWSDRLCTALLPYLQSLSPKEARLQEIAGLLREWAYGRSDLQLHLSKCNRTCTRFTTPGMSALLPDLPDAVSGWNTSNCYFYEIANRSGQEVHINFVISGKNLSPALRALCEQINRFYPSFVQKTDWLWRTHFTTSALALGDPLDKAALFAGLEQLLQEVFAFEQELKSKLHEDEQAQAGQ